MLASHTDAHDLTSHQQELLGFFRRRVPEEAEDLAQETWSRVLAASPACPDARALRAYVFTVARRVLVDRHRRRLRRVPLRLLGETEPDAMAPGRGSSSTALAQPDQRVQAADTAAVIQRELGRMRPEMAQVVRWRLYAGLPFREIASRQGVPLNTALGRMHRALRRIRRALDQANPTSPAGGTP